ncbi:MAG: hypothetical protein ABIJ09_17595 [Pseudomonadota bacterium]
MSMPALAAGGVGGDMGRFGDLINTGITWLQGLALAGCAIGFIRSGVMYNSGDPQARDAAKGAAMGAAVVAGAVIIVQFVKGFF